MLNVMAGFDARDSTSLERPAEDYTRLLDTPATGDRAKPLSGLRIGVPTEYFGAGLGSDVGAAVEAALAQFEKLGAKRVAISLPNSALSVPAYYVIAPAEASSNLSRFDGVRYGYRAPEYADLADMYSRPGRTATTCRRSSRSRPSSSAASTARSTSAWRSWAGPSCGARPGSPTRASRTPCSRRRAPPAAGRRSRTRERARSVPSGLRPA